MADAGYRRHHLGLSQAYMEHPASANFPRYTTHQSIVRKYLTLEVGITNRYSLPLCTYEVLENSRVTLRLVSEICHHVKVGRSH